MWWKRLSSVLHHGPWRQHAHAAGADARLGRGNVDRTRRRLSPIVSRDHVTGYRSRQAWSAVGWVRGSWPARSAARSSRRPATLFGTIPDPAEHPLAHHEGDRRDRLDQQRRPPLGVDVALAHQQPGRPVRLLPHNKGPGGVVGGRHRAHRHATAQHQRPARLHHGDAQPNLRVELDLVPDLEVLPLGHDPVGAVDVAADQVLQRVVAVEAAPPLPELGDPGPDPLGRGMHGDGAGCREVGVGDEVVTVQGGVAFLVGRPPSQLPPPDHQEVGRRTADDGSARGSCWTLHPIPPTVAHHHPPPLLTSTGRGLWANLASDSLEEVTAATERGLQRTPGSPHWAYSFPRHWGRHRASLPPSTRIVFPSGDQLPPVSKPGRPPRGDPPPAGSVDVSTKEECLVRTSGPGWIQAAEYNLLAGWRVVTWLVVAAWFERDRSGRPDAIEVPARRGPFASGRSRCRLQESRC